METINVMLADLPAAIKAYTVSNRDDSYTIVLNARCSHEQHLLSYQHELNHIAEGDYDRSMDVNTLEVYAHQSDLCKNKG